MSGDHPPNSNLFVVNANKSSDNAISNDIVNSEPSKSGNSGISNDIINSESNMNDDSNVSDMQSNNDISSVDNDEVNENVYETSSEGLLSDEDSGDNDSDDEEEPSVNESTNTVPSVNIVSPGSSLCGLSVSSGSQPPLSRLPVAVGKGSSSTIGSKIPKVPGAGVRKASSSRPAGLSLGMRKACLNAADEMVLSIITINVNGLRDAGKRAGVVQWLQALPSPIDIVCLQEVHYTSVEGCTRWFSSTGLFCVLSSGSVHSCGCVVLYCPRLSLVGSWSDADGRFVQSEFSFQAKLFRVACIYAPNRNPARDAFFSDVEVRVDPSVPTLLCGDFNAVFDRLLDRVGSDPFDTAHESSVALSRLFSSCCVLDIWRYLHLSSNSFTWSRWNELIFLGFLSLGFLLSLLVISFVFRFLTTVRFTYLSLSLKPLSQVLDSGS